MKELKQISKNCSIGAINQQIYTHVQKQEKVATMTYCSDVLQLLNNPAGKYLLKGNNTGTCKNFMNLVQDPLMLTCV